MQHTQHIKEYLKKVKAAYKELTKKEAFRDLLNRLYYNSSEITGIIDKIGLGAEHTIVNIPRKDKLHKGSADTLYNQVLIEFENNLKQTEKHAKEQLAGYLLGQFKSGKGYNYTLIASDFINWKVYALDITQIELLDTLNEHELKLENIASSSFSLNENNADEFYYWLDRFLFKEEKHSPKNEITKPVKKTKPGKTWLPDEWYQLLVRQSRTDHIYDLIHGFMDHLWDPGHRMDFVTVRRKNLPEKLKDLPEKHISKTFALSDYTFPGDDYILLDNNFLTEYLEVAKTVKMIEDFSGRGFLELGFEPIPIEYTEDEEDDERDKRNLVQEEKWMAEAYEELVRDGDKEKALSHLPEIEQWLKLQIPAIDTPHGISSYQWLCGWNILAMVYAWCGKLNKAAEADKQYLFRHPIWEVLDETINSYLEMLMIKKETDYLDWVFSDADFRKYFLLHYEVYISLFKNSHYEITVNMGLFVNVVNKISNSKLYRLG